ncbi:MAG: hypothetical protein RR659_04910 [Bacilli bacterium]
MDNLFKEPSFLKRINDNVLLYEEEIAVLKRYNIDYETCNTMEELIFKIEDEIYEEEIEDLELISNNLSERNYYQNTLK